jgi:hypothetical protein
MDATSEQSTNEPAAIPSIRFCLPARMEEHQVQIDTLVAREAT